MLKLSILFSLFLVVACEANDSDQCDFLFDIAGGYQRIENGKTALNTGESFFGDICALKSELKKVKGSLITDDQKEYEFIGIWTDRGRILARTENGRFIIAEIFDSYAGMTKEEIKYLNSVQLAPK